MRRPARDAFLLLYLGAHIAVPLSWYATGDGSDERFAWRMFSVTNERSCRARLFETVAGRERPVDALAVVPRGWTPLFRKGNAPVVSEALRAVCGRGDGEEASYFGGCNRIDGRPLPPIEMRLRCESSPT